MRIFGPPWACTKPGAPRATSALPPAAASSRRRRGTDGAVERRERWWVMSTPWKVGGGSLQRGEEVAPAAVAGDVECAAAGGNAARLAHEAALAAAVGELDAADCKRRANQREKTAPVRTVHLPPPDLARP